MTYIKLYFVDGKTTMNLTRNGDFITFAKKFFKQSVYYATPSDKGNKVAIDTDKVMIMEEIIENDKNK